MVDFEIQKWCFNLESSRVKTRKEACVELNELLRRRSAIDFLKTSDTDLWTKLLKAIFACMLKDHEKQIDDSRKKSGDAPTRAPSSADLFSLFVRTAVKEDSCINFMHLIQAIVEWLDDGSKKIFQHTFLKVLSESLLTSVKVRSQFEETDWRTLFRVLKSLSTDVISDSEQIKCLALVVKFAPSHKFPVGLFRHQFHYVINLAQKVTSKSPKPQQEAILDLIFNFCRHTAKDNRMMCCRLGEDIFRNFIDLYQNNTNEDAMKANLIQFFLFQVTIHNPKGVTVGNPVAFAISWDFWRGCLRTIYDILTFEIDTNLKLTIKNAAFFIRKNGVSELFDSFVQLFVEVSRQLFEVGTTKSEEPVTKRRKTEFNVANLIEKIQETKSWPWLNLTYPLLETYPDVVTRSDYLILLKILISLQSETKETNLLHHVHKALIVLLKIESLTDVIKSDVDSLWRSVSDITLRLNNQNDENIQTLLQLLILNKHLTSHDALLQYYRPGGALNADEHNLKTIDVAFKTFPMLQFDQKLKKQTINWILSNLQESKRDQVGEILVCLVMKQWPRRHFTFSKVGKPFEAIEDVYFSTCFRNLLINSESSENNEEKEVFCLDQNLLDYLTDALRVVIESVDVRHEDFYNTNMLVYNVLSYLYKYELISGTNLTLYELFRTSLGNFFENLNLKISEADERHLYLLTESVQKLHDLFSVKVSDFMAGEVRALFPDISIKDLFRLLNFKDVLSDHVLKLQKTVMATLVTFALLPTSERSALQNRAFQALVGVNYDCNEDTGYELAVTFLDSVKICAPKNLDGESLMSIFDILQNLCEARYYCNVSVATVLDFFHVIYPVVVSSRSTDCKNSYIAILYPFHCKRLSYEPSISVRLLQCMSLLFQLEPSSTNTKWSNQEIVYKIPEFLCSEYQEVRFCAIRTLATIFRTSSKMPLLDQYHRQEMLFSKICDMSVEVLQIEGSIDDNRKIDETVSRSASIFHTFASIMVASNLWTEQALFSLLNIVCDRNLGLAQVEIIIEMAALKLGFQSGLKFLERYLAGLVNRWRSSNGDFPFTIVQCCSKVHLYSTYWPLLAYTFLTDSNNSATEVAANLRKSQQQLIEDSAPKLFSHCLGQEVSNLASISQNKIFRLIHDTLGEDRAQEIYRNNIEEVILCLVQFVSDEADYEERFSQKIIFPKSENVSLTVEEFHGCLRYLETSLYSGASVISTLMHSSPGKIHFLLLQLNLRINGFQALEDKLRHFHLYSLLCSLCVDSVIGEPSMRTYLIREVTHTLLHNIRDHKRQPDLSEISCVFFKTILERILPVLADVVKEFFLVIISRLKYVALESCCVSLSCVKMLEMLIVAHRDLFVSEISKLDSVPDRFTKIFSVHSMVKYGERKVTLEDEIVQFLDFSKNIESLNECEHSIIHLKRLLTSKKDELEAMFTDLRKTRGLSEDCERSNLHKLISLLIVFSSSSNRKVSMEAARCLGEIGPADLTTLILQPEKRILDPKWTPWELFLGCATSLLSKYLVEADVKVVKSASLALFQILRTKEGRKVVQSEEDFGFGSINANYLTPFRDIEWKTTAFKANVDGDCFLKVIQDDELWIPEHCQHDEWVKRLVCTFLETFQEKQFFRSVIEVCRIKVEFCEQILPLIVYVVLFWNNFSYTSAISRQIEVFFNKHWDITVNNLKSVNITTNKSSVQTMLNVVHFVRLQKSVRKKDVRALKLDYLRVAKAAHFCTAHFTALLYADQWCQEQIDQSSDDYAVSTCSYTKLDLIYEKVDEVTGNALQKILQQAYKSVGERDALLGCGTSHLLSPASRVDHYKELGRWDLVTQYYERQVSLGRNEALRPLVDSLKSANLYQMSLFCSQSSEEANYESLWRLGQWSDDGSGLSHNYDKAKYDLLKSLHNKEDFGFMKALDDGRTCVVADFASANMESSKHFYHTFAKLQSLTEIEDFSEALKHHKIPELLLKWKTQDDIVCNDYQYTEPIQAQRVLLLTDVLRAHAHTPDLRDPIVDSMLAYAQCARIEGNSHVAFRILENLRSLLPLSNEIDAKMKLEEAQLCWSIHDVVTAKCILRQLCTSENVGPRVHAMALKMTGQWMVESSSENRQTIIENYFQKSLNLIKGGDDHHEEDEKSIVETFEQLAKFTDREYQVLMTHIKSDIFQKKKLNIKKSKELISNIQVKKATTDLKKAILLQKKWSCIDEIEIHSTEIDKDNLLILALRYYLRILVKSDDYNMTIFRLFSLLLENRNNEKVKPILEKYLLKIPTYKFISILPQIIPHISNVSSDIFTQTVNNLIEKCARDHPYHTLPLILSLALSNKDREYSESKAVTNDTRTQSARSLLNKLEKDRKLSNLIQKMERVSEAIIELAYQKNADSDKPRVPKNAKIRKIRNFDDILIPTLALPIDTSCQYDRIVGIANFSDIYHNVGGINAPKRITCLGTDGLPRTQLIKGQDDLRQDAVMQQVFTIMNNLLNVNKQTKNLKIRTYKVVPLSMRSGILEWVDNTMPIGEYLVGESGAHQKFRPQDTAPTKCRLEFKNSASCKTTEERIRAFNKICGSIKPVFHKFFETTFPQPTVWYERRRTYIHSVAASSMCGYILGIGDRHLMNILIDKNTAEVVHIDFGIAFEQGRVLNTPETVPFRLTRDLVDGMGVSGVEGVFRRSCEKTVEVLRLHYQTIITILEVLLYDPLYDWTVSSAEANKRQKDEQDEGEENVSQGTGSDESVTKDVNETAERALLRLRAKLQGTESGKATTVEHQVGTLIQQAVDPSNLCRLFYGWQPYL